MLNLGLLGSNLNFGLLGSNVVCMSKEDPACLQTNVCRCRHGPNWFIACDNPQVIPGLGKRIMH